MSRGEKLDIVVAGYLIEGDKILLIHHKKLNKWLPFGGHIEKDETPDEALRREAREEIGAEIEFLHYPAERRGNQKQWATPFYQNVHLIVEGHSHYCLFFLCKLKEGEKVNPNKEEMHELKWVSEEDLAGLEPSLNEGDIATCKEVFRLSRQDRLF
ncbi:MAG: NUDIX domain-containing protein [archaeon]|jgi:8-oxo-dGTP pyrophosphatase MutT (NUDIX family)|nr:NUDIX domain-containing protein [archaeon]